VTRRVWRGENRLGRTRSRISFKRWRTTTESEASREFQSARPGLKCSIFRKWSGFPSENATMTRSGRVSVSG